MAAPWGGRGQGHRALAPALGTSPPSSNSWILPPSQLQTPGGKMSPWGGLPCPQVSPLLGVKAEGQQQQLEAEAGSPPARHQQMLQHLGTPPVAMTAWGGQQVRPAPWWPQSCSPGVGGAFGWISSIFFLRFLSRGAAAGGPGGQSKPCQSLCSESYSSSAPTQRTPSRSIGVPWCRSAGRGQWGRGQRGHLPLGGSRNLPGGVFWLISAWPPPVVPTRGRWVWGGEPFGGAAHSPIPCAGEFWGESCRV